MDPSEYLQAAKYALSQGENERFHSLCQSLMDEHPNIPEADEARLLLGGGTVPHEPDRGAPSTAPSTGSSKSSARLWGMGCWTVLAILAGIGVMFVAVVVAVVPMMFTIFLAGGAASGGSSVLNSIPDPEVLGIILPGLLIVGVIWIAGMSLFRSSRSSKDKADTDDTKE